MIGINKGFETMLPVEQKVPKPFFNYSISFSLFKRRYSFTLDISGDNNVGDSNSSASPPGSDSGFRDWLAE